MKIALIYSFNESNWFSCTKIVTNLLSAYDEALKEDEILRLNYNHEDENFTLSDLVSAIIENNPDKLIFLDHKPHPFHVLKQLFADSPNFNSEICIHIYGDFTLLFLKWMASERYLKDKKVKFFCASDAQVGLVEKCLSGDCVSKIPFPVDSSEFYYEPKPKDIRDKYGLPKDSKIYLYTGRLSAQKKISELMEGFDRAIISSTIDKNSYLILAGAFDSIGLSFGGIHEFEGEYFRKWKKTLDSFDPKVQDKIKFVGMVKNSDLVDYYNSSNYFVSLSTYHDEDYGMSVAEAGCCGTPLILSDWAGFKSFKFNKTTKVVKTELGLREPNLIVESIDDMFSELVNIKAEQRTFDSKSFNDYCSVSAVATLLKQELSSTPEKFKGFNHFFSTLARLEGLRVKIFYDEHEKELNSNYRELYEVYASDS
jgi:glycosyltransferase involved in cell wall biosynthesis